MELFIIWILAGLVYMGSLTRSARRLEVALFLPLDALFHNDIDNYSHRSLLSPPSDLVYKLWTCHFLQGLLAWLSCSIGLRTTV